MNNTLKLFSLIAFIFILSSCGKDTCYECTGDSTLTDLGTICEGDTDGNGNVASAADVESAVATYEALGGTCNKK